MMAIQEVFAMLVIIRVLSLSHVSVAATPNSSVECPWQDGGALRAFQQSVGAAFLIQQNWPVHGNSCVCSWAGVLCDAGRITSLQISIQWNTTAHKPMAASVDNVSLTHLCRLSELRALNLTFDTEAARRKFTIPSCLLCSLTNLVNISLVASSDSLVGGELPPCQHVMGLLAQLILENTRFGTGGGGESLEMGGDSVCMFQNLTTLHLRANFPKGIPSCLWDLHKLTSLSLAKQLGVASPTSSFAVPDTLCKLHNLRSLILEGFTGIHSCLSELHQLTSLQFADYNQASILPDSICKLQNLMELDLSGFTNRMPSCLGELRQLTWLALDGSGTVSLSDSLCSLQNLTDLNLSRFTGRIPSCLWEQLQQLTSLNIIGSEYPEAWPDSLCKFQNLNFLSLERATITSGHTSVVPACVCSLPQLQTLQLYSVNIDASCFSSPTNPVLSFISLEDSTITAVQPTLLNLSSFVNLQTLQLDTQTQDQNLVVSINSLCTLTGLQTLELTNLATSEGRIPPCIGNLPNLQSLVISQASLYPAELPSFLSNLTTLEYLDLSSNSFKGSIPAPWQNLSRLTSLTLSYNPQLSLDSLPQWLFKLPLLSQLSLSACNLGPESLHCSNLLQLNSTLSGVDLSNNNLSADILHCFADYPSGNLQSIDLSDNPFDTYFPDKFPQTIASLSLGSCKLRGNLTPTFIDSQPHLQYLNLSGNYLVGDIPLGTREGWSSPLSGLYLSDNKFTGVAASGNLSALRYFFVSKNNLTSDFPLLLGRLGGTTPSALCAPGNKWLNLDFSGNALTGILPPTLGRCSSLERLYLGNNRIEGEIPPELGNLSQLQTLSLAQNSLSGEIPQALSNCTSLVLLDLSHNALSGNLEQSAVSNLSNLRVLVLASNGFHGCIPAWIGNFSAVLQVIDLSNNNFSGTVPENLQLAAFSNSNNNNVSLGGTLYYEDSVTLTVKGNEYTYITYNLAVMITIDLSRNRLTGVIPSRLTELYGLVSLNLSNNQFSGCIPVNLSNLGNLESLDLSYNSLEGPIPNEFTNLNSLGFFNVSYNPGLSGRIPSYGHLLTFSNDSYIGDSRLCGVPILQPCNLVASTQPVAAIMAEPQPIMAEPQPNPFHHFVEEWISIPAIFVGAPIMFVLTLVIIRIYDL